MFNRALLAASLPLLVGCNSLDATFRRSDLSAGSRPVPAEVRATRHIGDEGAWTCFSRRPPPLPFAGTRATWAILIHGRSYLEGVLDRPFNQARSLIDAPFTLLADCALLPYTGARGVGWLLTRDEPCEHPPLSGETGEVSLGS